jgi:hypothetical protein
MSKVGRIDDPVWTMPPADADTQGRPNKKHRIVVIVFLLVLGVAVVYPIVAAGLSRKDYGTFAFWKVPNRIDYCGRRYYDGGPEPGSPALFESQDSAAGARWSLLSLTFSGRSIYADVTPAGPPDDTVCTMSLYIPLGGGTWEVYGLSGGR